MSQVKIVGIKLIVILQGPGLAIYKFCDTKAQALIHKEYNLKFTS